MTAHRSNDSEDVVPMGPRAWRLHVVGALQDADSHRQLIEALVQRPFEGALRHVLCDVDTQEADAKVALLADAPEARREADRA